MRAKKCLEDVPYYDQWALKKMKKNGIFTLCFHGQKVDTFIIFLEIFIQHKKPDSLKNRLHCNKIAQ